MVRSELLQKFCNQHPQLLRRDVEKILEIIFFQITEALLRGETMSCGNPCKHVIQDSKETFSKSCRVLIQRNDWCDLVSNYETDVDEINYENEFLEFGICSMDF